MISIQDWKLAMQADLELVESAVFATRNFKKFVVLALLDQAAVFENKNFVSLANR